jgi:hypothetical protein
MIYAQISPAAQKIEQITPFSSVTTTANYMVAFARPYALGANKVTFQVVYGIPEFTDGTVSRFEGIAASEVDLDSSEISSWGTDDTVVFTQIASKLGISILSTVTGID